MPQLRAALPEDVAGILALISSIYAEYGFRLDTDGIDRHLLDPGPYFRARGGEFWVVEDAGVIRATVAVLMLETAGELKSLYVHPAMRRQGWGRRLTHVVMDYARRALAGRNLAVGEERRLILWSDARFLDAHRLYQGMGLERFGSRELHDINNTVEYGFELPLD